MSDTERHHLAQRMSALLQRELGEGIDARRMVSQPLYARDVLLVCQALHGTELPELAERYLAAGVGAGTGASSGRPAGNSAGEGPPSEAPESTGSGWVASLWPATMRGGLRGNAGKRPGVKPPRR